MLWPSYDYLLQDGLGWGLAWRGNFGDILMLHIRLSNLYVFWLAFTSVNVSHVISGFELHILRMHLRKLSNRVPSLCLFGLLVQSPVTPIQVILTTAISFLSIECSEKYIASGRDVKWAVGFAFPKFMMNGLDNESLPVTNTVKENCKKILEMFRA